MVETQPWIIRIAISPDDVKVSIARRTRGVCLTFENSKASNHVPNVVPLRESSSEICGASYRGTFKKRLQPLEERGFAILWDMFLWHNEALLEGCHSQLQGFY
jgi:hypothetical protein